jgi:hypothetical protein
LWSSRSSLKQLLIFTGIWNNSLGAVQVGWQNLSMLQISAQVRDPAAPAVLFRVLARQDVQETLTELHMG